MYGVARCIVLFFVLMRRRPPRSTLDRSSAASDVYKRQGVALAENTRFYPGEEKNDEALAQRFAALGTMYVNLSLIHISEPTRPY